MVGLEARGNAEKCRYIVMLSPGMPPLGFSNSSGNCEAYKGLLGSLC